MSIIAIFIVVEDKKPKEPTVHDYFIEAFPRHRYSDDNDLKAMSSIPIESTCGDDCRRAIDQGMNMMAEVRSAHGQFPKATTFENQISEMVADVCCVYICG